MISTAKHQERLPANLGFLLPLALTTCLASVLIVSVTFPLVRRTSPQELASNVTTWNSTLAPLAKSPVPLNWQNYTNSIMGVAFLYPGESLLLDSDDEAKYSERSHFDVRETFIRMLGYSPPQLISAVGTVDRKAQQDGYLLDHFTVWVFDNQGKLSIEDWYRKYRYYPFVWGKAVESAIEYDRPKNTAKINELVMKYAILDDMGAAQYGYISSDERMFLIVTRSDLGNQVLSTFTVQSK
jgi:hypothetical protein